MRPTKEAILLAEHLQQLKVRFVLAESCTAGLVAATLGAVPGISQWMCGSTVSYRDRSKVDWLDVSPDDIERHTSVSRQVTFDMAVGILDQTPEAKLCAAVTGHLGPSAPAVGDGKLFVATGIRRPTGIAHIFDWSGRLTQSGRSDRQDEAVAVVIRRLNETLLTHAESISTVAVV